MPCHVRHLLALGLGLVAAACAPSARVPSATHENAARPSACEAQGLLHDPGLYTRFVRVTAEADSIAAAGGGRVLVDTAVYAALSARLERAMADTALHERLSRIMADSAVQVRLEQLGRQLDSMLACAQPGGGARRR